MASAAVTVTLHSPAPRPGALGGVARAFGPARASCRVTMQPLSRREVETDAGTVIHEQWALYLPPVAGIQPGDGVGRGGTVLFRCTDVKQWPYCAEAVIKRLNDTEG